MLIPDLSQDLARLRKQAGRSQTWVAEKLGVDAARVSRWESGEIRPSESDVEGFLRSLKSDEAADYLRFRKETWGRTEKPSYWHPDRTTLHVVNAVLEEIDAFCRRNDVPRNVQGEIDMHIASLQRGAEYLFSREHQIAFVGEIGVGKSTAICALANLMLPSLDGDTLQKRSALQTGAGRITICEMRIKTGLVLGISVEPQSDEEVFTLVGDLCARFFSEETASAEKVDRSIPEETERALRNMAGLAKTTRIGADGKPTIVDPIEELRASRPSLDQLRAEFLVRLQLSRRTRRDISYPERTNEVDVEWLRRMAIAVNSGKISDVGLPKRIDVILPRPVLENTDGSALYDVTLIDTKGLDEVGGRRDISELLNDSRTLTLLTSDFRQAPGGRVSALLEQASAIGLKNGILSRAAVFVVAHPGHAAAMIQGLDDDGGGDQVGYLLKEGEVNNALLKLHYSLPILIFNAGSDDRRNMAAQLLGLVTRLRQSEVDGVLKTREAVRAMFANFGKTKAEGNRKEVAKRLAIELSRLAKLPASVRPAHNHLLEVMKSSHATTVWAASRRNGSYWNLDVYHSLGSGAVADAELRTRDGIQGINNVVDNMLGDERLGTSHEFLKELRKNIAYWEANFLQEVRRAGEEEFKSSLKDDDEVWLRCRSKWGTGLGDFRGRVAKEIQEWFESPARQHLRSALESRITEAWTVEVLSHVRRVCLDDEQEVAA